MSRWLLPLLLLPEARILHVVMFLIAFVFP